MKNYLTLIVFICLSFTLQAQTASVQYSFSGDATDLSGNGNNGTLAPGTNSTFALKIGNNNSNYLTVPSGAIDGLTDFSLNFKIEFTGLTCNWSFANKSYF